MSHSRLAFFMAHAPQRSIDAPSEQVTESAAVPVQFANDVAMRARGIPGRDSTRVQIRIAWFITLLVHLFLWFALRESMRPLPDQDGAPILVELIAAPIPPPAVAPLIVEPLPRTVPVLSARTAAPRTLHPNATKPRPSTAPAATPSNMPPAGGNAADAPPMRFYNPDSSANIPKDLLAQIQRDQPKPDFIAKQFVQPEFMQHKNPLHYLATDFEPTWVPINENLLDEFVRRNLTREVTFKTPWGGTIRCTWVFVMGACAGVPPPAWKNPEKKALPPPAPEWQ